jgi:PhnB protein
MKNGVKYLPDGYHTVTPYLVLDGAAKAIEFYKKAFGAEELCRMAMPGSDRLGHAEVRIGNSMLMMSDECLQAPGNNRSPKTLGGTTAGIHIYVPDVDAAFGRAVAAGATVEMPPTDMFWGDRFAKLRDPFGHSWSLATHKEDVPPDEMDRRAQECFAQMAKQTAAQPA